MKTKTYTVALGVWAMVLAGQTWADDVVMFRDAPPPSELADIMFPQAAPAAPTIKFRGIRFTEPVATLAATPEQIVEASKAKAVGFNISFAFNSAELMPETLAHLDSMGETLKLEQAADQRVRISGHADASGSDEYNQWLSQARAQAVQDYLMEHHGIPPGRLEIIGFGESQPLAGSDPYDGVKRRVEFAAVQ